MNLDALKHLSLLYVEDEPLIRQNAVEYLARYCHRVYEAKDGIEGLEMYERHKPDIIISDISMPRLSGLDFASKIRKLDKSTPIVLATAHTKTEYLLKAVELQLIKYLVKPITSEKLEEALTIACHTLSDDHTHYIALDSITNYDTLNKTLILNDKLVKLTHNELLFFDFIVKNRQRVITYEEIENLIWTYEGMSMDALRSLVRGLRKKLHHTECIENISGVGYRLHFSSFN
jgi:DNA-binding response OmpR family regulator